MNEKSSEDRDRAALVRDTLQSIRALSDALDRMYSGMKGDMDMNMSDLAALRMLIMREHRGASVSPHEIAAHLRISTASTTKLLDRLARAGYVERQPHPRDRRARIVVLTDYSRASFFSHFRAHLGEMREVADRFSDEELSVIARFLWGLTGSLDPSSGE